MARALKACAVRGCPTPTVRGRCERHRRAADQQRGTAAQRGYRTAGHKAFRDRVLRRDPICVLCRLRASTVADHWPLSRRELLEQGHDPDDPGRGRGLCKGCHDRSTARQQPGGWHDRPGG